MIKLVLGAAAALSAAAGASAADAAAYTSFDMGTLSATTTKVGGSNDTKLSKVYHSDTLVTAAQLTAASSFDLMGMFSVSPGAFGNGASTRLQLTGADGIGNVTAVIYHRAPGGQIGAAAATLTASCAACLQSSSAWVFMSPTAFALDPGNYLFEVKGSKGAGNALNYQLAVTTVPLPGAAVMFGAGLLVVGGLAACRKGAARQAI